MLIMIISKIMSANHIRKSFKKDQIISVTLGRWDRSTSDSYILKPDKRITKT